MTQQIITANRRIEQVEPRFSRLLGIAPKQLVYFWQVNALIAYFILMLLGGFWFLLDVWSGNFTILRGFGLSGEILTDPLLKTIGYTMVGAVFGSVLFQIRSLFNFYLKSGKYDPRWIGKYISAPWESAAMALVVLSLIRGGVALFGGSSGTDVNATNNFAAFGTGALVGYGMRDVVKWLGRLVISMFRTDEEEDSEEAELDQIAS
jgi:hypothetical protein